MVRRASLVGPVRSVGWSLRNAPARPGVDFFNPSIEASTLLNRGLVIWKEAPLPDMDVLRSISGELDGRPRIL